MDEKREPEKDAPVDGPRRAAVRREAEDLARRQQAERTSNKEADMRRRMEGK